MYTSAIWTAERSANLAFAKEVLDEMNAEGVPANSVSYAGVISTAAKSGFADEAFAFYEESRRVGCPAIAATYNVSRHSV
jgi:pentatricopeptide repeat protein